MRQQHRLRLTAAGALRATLCLGGTVASAAGLHAMLVGARSIPGIAVNADPVTESELRFFSAFYAAYGLRLLALGRRSAVEPGSVDAVAAPLFAAGLARVAGWRSVGRPNAAQLALLGLELGLPPSLSVLARTAR